MLKINPQSSTIQLSNFSSPVHWDNAPCESFWGKLKQEWLAQYGPFENIEQVRLALFEYIDGYYYAKRLHQALGYRTPRDVEEEFLQNH